jgi:chromosome segregation ATPase
MLLVAKEERLTTQAQVKLAELGRATAEEDRTRLQNELAALQQELKVVVDALEDERNARGALRVRCQALEKELASHVDGELVSKC